jgi:hypothetical protein
LIFLQPAPATLCVGLVIGAAASCAAQAVAELSADQRALLDSTRQVSIVTEITGQKWPRTCVYQFIQSTPEEAAAVFTDYDRQKSYVSSLHKSAISRVIDKRTVEVDYTLDVPIVADEDYTVRDRLSSDTTSYRVDWSFVRASSTKAIEGNARFEPYSRAISDSAGTLLAYCNLVTPGSRLAGLGFVKSRATNEVRATAKAIAMEVERERTRDHALLEIQLRALRTALAP